MKKEEEFSSRMGFIVSCVGAALGLGNIWMFSYRLGAYGGLVFLIPYFIFVFGLGATGLMIEFSFGRYFKGGAYTGIVHLFEKKKRKGGAFIGLIPPLGVLGILMFYAIVIGWVLRYFLMSLTGELMQINPHTYFDTFAGTAHVVPYFLMALVLTGVIVSLGIAKGIERINKWMMPFLMILFVVLTLRSVTLPGAEKGIAYLLTPRWEELMKVETWIMALGQAFFTVSLNGCGMVVYGRYTNKDFDIPSAAIHTALFDTLAALLAGFMIMPAVFAFGLDPAAGPALLFMTLPQVFQQIPYGHLLSILFFTSIVFAALSSSVNMLEAGVEALMTKTNKTRTLGCWMICGSVFILAIPLVINTTYFGQFADFVTIVISPLAALISAGVFLFWMEEDVLLQAINEGARRKVGRKFIKFGRYVFMPTTLLIIVLGILYGGIG